MGVNQTPGRIPLPIAFINASRNKHILATCFEHPPEYMHQRVTFENRAMALSKSCIPERLWFMETISCGGCKFHHSLSSNTKTTAQRLWFVISSGGRI